MSSRRDFLQLAAATAAIIPGGWTRAFAQQRLAQDNLLAFAPLGNVTLLHMADIHAQLLPVHCREPSANNSAGATRDQPPHLSGRTFLDWFGIAPGSAAAYALSSDDYEALARTYGRVGGLDRAATVIKAIRAERPGKVLLLDGGDTWQGSWTALQTRGQDMADCMALLQPDAMTGHFEFTYGQERVRELAGLQKFPFLALNIRDAEWNEPVFAPQAMFERGGVMIAVLGQAFPYTPIANPRHFIPDWNFGLREDEIQRQVDAARAKGAELVVLLSHNGFDVDFKLAQRVRGIDVILTGHTHDALPQAINSGDSLLIASGSCGKFISRLDLDVQGGAIRDFNYRLIPLFADVIAPDAEMAARIAQVRAPYAAELSRVLGQADELLYRRDSFHGTLDDLLLGAMLQMRDCEIALSPGFRWGTSLLPGEDITFEALTNATAITYPACTRTLMSGARLKELLEDVADNLFNPDPYYQQGGDMVRAGGLAYRIDVDQPRGRRISQLVALRTGEAIEPGRDYRVAGWASVAENALGPPIWEVAESWLKLDAGARRKPAWAVKVG